MTRSSLSLAAILRTSGWQAVPVGWYRARLLVSLDLEMLLALQFWFSDRKNPDWKAELLEQEGRDVETKAGC